MALGDLCLPNASKMADEIEKWANKSEVKNVIVNPYEAAFRLASTEFNMEFEDIALRSVDITKGQLSSFKGRLNDLIVDMNQNTLDRKFATTFWQTSHYAKKDPMIGSLLRNMQLSNFYFRSHESTDKVEMKTMLGHFEDESISRNLTTRLGLKKGAAQKEAQRLDDRLNEQRAKYKDGDPDAMKNMEKIYKELNELVSTTYLEVYDDMLYMIENDVPRVEKAKFDAMTAEKKEPYLKGKKRIKLSKTDLIDVKMKSGKDISDNMYKALTSYQSLMDGLYTRLRHGTGARINSIISRLKYLDTDVTKHELRDIRNKLEAKMMPRYEGAGFFPHYTRDLTVDFMDGLMPRFDALQTAANPYMKNKDTKTLREVIDGISRYVSGHTYTRSPDYEYSRNFLNSITNYIYDVNRFNYLSFMDKNIMDSLTTIESVYKTDGDAKGYSQSLINYIQYLHVAANGNSNVSPKTAAMMKTLLSFEFISKLGINPRGAARNWFQRLLDYVEWGPVQVKRTKNIINRMSISESSIDDQLKKVGLLFEETSPQLLESEISGKADIFKVIKYNPETDKHTFEKQSSVEKVSEKVGWLAGKSSWLHRKAENSNRKHTFKVAFAQMYDWLDGPRFKKVLKAERADITDSQMEKQIMNRARNYAINMVVLNHFDYADYAKSKLLTKSWGRFMFQFQHYSFEFFERNAKIVREAKHDIKEGRLLPGENAQGLQKAYRMAIAYFGAPVMASMLMGVDFTNLIEHDTATRLKQLAVAFTGDDDEIKQAFYGKGPIVSTFGGPLMSDLLDIGVMLDLINIDEESLLALLSGLEKYDPSTQSTGLSKKIRILNTFLGRAVERHIPQMKKGRVGWAVQQEFGLYPTAEARKAQKVAEKAVEQILPPEIAAALEKLAAS